ncbi:MAG: ABC transporter permease [Lachnospiraceae bacterium]|nr:ABC transporter permease [Lachnospiraceae bacterium]
MRLFFNRLAVLTKRSFINPAMYVMAGVILLMTLLVILVPEKETSVYIPVALLNKDNSPETEEIVDSLCSRNSIFHFYEIDDEDELYRDLASGKANTAYIFPCGFIEHVTDKGTKYDVQQVSTPASSFIFLSREEVFESFYSYSARDIIIQTFASHGYEVDAHDPVLEELFGKYIDSQYLFALESVEGTVYNAITRSEKVPIPLYKFAGFFIFTAALLGTLAFLNDQDNRIYLRFGLAERIYLGLIQVAVFTFPAMIMSVICFLISRTEFSLLHVILYTFFVTLIALAAGTVMTLIPIRTSRSKIFSSVLPVYLILSFLFSGILMDLTNFGTALRTLSRLFPPSMF